MATPLLAQSSEPIRVGLLAAKTSPLASGGIDMDLALTMFLKERDNVLAGRKVELIVARYRWRARRPRAQRRRS